MTKIKISYEGNLETECLHVESGAKIRTAAPKDNHGTGGGFSPTDLLTASLGACMLTLMGIAARKWGVDLKGTRLEVEKEMVSVPSRRVGRLIVRVFSPLQPDAPIRQHLETAALNCPVYVSLHPEIVKEVDFVWGIFT